MVWVGGGVVVCEVRESPPIAASHPLFFPNPLCPPAPNRYEVEEDRENLTKVDRMMTEEDKKAYEEARLKGHCTINNRRVTVDKVRRGRLAGRSHLLPPPLALRAFPSAPCPSRGLPLFFPFPARPT